VYILTLTKNDWRELRSEVLTIAKQVIRPPERAEAVTQEAFARLFDRRKFDESSIEGFDTFTAEAKREALEFFLLGIVRSVACVDKTSASRRHGYEKLAGHEQNALTGTTEASAESVMIENEDRARAIADASRMYEKLRAQLAGQRLELGVCDSLSEGVAKPSAIAEHLACTAEEVYVALRRVRRMMKRIVAEERGEPYAEESP
jgi:DNA-directed RNA polymerase specialized sigma24 family protein